MVATTNEVSVATGVKGTTTLLDIRNVAKSFGPNPVLRDISLQIAEGEFLTILGESGSGKTTLLRIIAGFESADAGEIWMAGERLDRQPPYRRRVNTVFQHYALFPHLTVAENVVLGLEPTKYSYLLNIDRTLKDIKSLSDRYRLQVDPKAIVSTIPVGVQQRVEILKALYRRAEILILDEPTSILTRPEAAAKASPASIGRVSGRDSAPCQVG